MAIEKADGRRLQMINAQLRTSDINELEILSAFTDVSREKFVAPGLEALAYADGEVAAAGPKGRKLLSPRTLGLLLKCVAPVAGERALVVGGGAGYCAALLAALGLDVVALETDASAARAATAGNARISHVEGGLTEPPAGKGPFDVIVVNGAFEITPNRLIGALSEKGRLVGLSAATTAKRIVLFERSGGGISETALYDAAGDVLPGFARARTFAF
jgi:protein-L-isoaspartate(D-aspartate) O-methyltransferase